MKEDWKPEFVLYVKDNEVWKPYGGWDDDDIESVPDSIRKKYTEIRIVPNDGKGIKEGVSKNMTPEEIASKHKVSIDKINKQLEKGIKVEKEHTNDEKKARRIALDHLFEIPDYYDRLNKMENGALKEGAFNYQKGDLKVGDRVRYGKHETEILDLEWEDKFGYDVLIQDKNGEKIWVGDKVEKIEEELNEDTIKTKSGKWVNKGKEGTHGTFKTKKEADAQRKAMFAQGYKENLGEGKDAQKVIDRITRAKLKGLDEVATDALESGYIEKKLDELYGWQLASLWSMCMLSEENDYSGQPYDDEVYDAISKRRDSENIFELADEIYAKFFKKSKNESLKESISIDDELVEGIYYILKKGVTQYGEDFDFEHNDRDYNCNIETSSYDKTWMDITIVDNEKNEIITVESYPAPPYMDEHDDDRVKYTVAMDIAERVYDQLDNLTESIGGFFKYKNWLRKNGKKDNEESYYGYLQDTDKAFKSMSERDRRTQVQNMFSHRYMKPVTEGKKTKRNKK